MPAVIVADAADVIEHETAGTLQEPALPFTIVQVEPAPLAKSEFALHARENVFPAFGPSVRCEHRVEHEAAIRVKADPVVRKHCIRLRRQRAVMDDTAAHARRPESRVQRVELGACRERAPRRIAGRHRHPIAQRGLGVEREVCGPHEQYGARALPAGREQGCFS